MYAYVFILRLLNNIGHTEETVVARHFHVHSERNASQENNEDDEATIPNLVVHDNGRAALHTFLSYRTVKMNRPFEEETPMSLPGFDTLLPPAMSCMPEQNARTLPPKTVQ